MDIKLLRNLTLLSALVFSTTAGADDALISIQEYLNGLRKEWQHMVEEADKQKFHFWVNTINVKFNTVSKMGADGKVEAYVLGLGADIEKIKTQEVSFVVHLTEPGSGQYKKVEVESDTNPLPQNPDIVVLTRKLEALEKTLNELAAATAQAPPQYGSYGVWRPPYYPPTRGAPGSRFGGGTR